MYLEQQKELVARLRALLEALYQIVPEKIAIEQPPNLAFGEYALPIAFELARQLKRAPRKIAEEIVAGLQPLRGFASFEVAGAGYINAKLDRAAAVTAIAAQKETGAAPQPGNQLRSLVEHTSINPNKAAHIGHLRNAILGDAFVRLLRAAGRPVDVQNYIDNTGVQVADIVVALTHLEGYDLDGVVRLLAELDARGQRVDYYCWDLYAHVSQWYDSEPRLQGDRKELRRETLHAIEHGGNQTSAIAELISTAVLRRHLETMLRLGIEYDLLPRESEILHLKFWELAFGQLRSKGVVYLETEGKNRGCWVMRRAGTAKPEREAESAGPAGENGAGEQHGSEGEAATGPDEDAKIIVRSNGTVTYVGKDIAYHLWKFGLLGRDFGYAPFFDYGDGRQAWISTETGVENHPHFGGAQAIYNVIDSRQSDPQANVMEALRALGYAEAAAHYTHFSYEMVALTPRCAAELGYAVSEQDRQRPYIEVSGRKGFGVKADDLIDRMIAAAQKEVDSRHPERAPEERERIAREIAIGALRYFMLKYTRNSVIAFDFAEALGFEGETGPYVQYAIVRARNIFRKAGIAPEDALNGIRNAPLDQALLTGERGDGIWELWLAASKLSLVLEQCISAAEPAYLAKHAFVLAQLFNNFYHRQHILTEQDEERRHLLLATAALVECTLVRSLDWLGITAPEVM